MQKKDPNIIRPVQGTTRKLILTRTEMLLLGLVLNALSLEIHQIEPICFKAKTQKITGDAQVCAFCHVKCEIKLDYV